MKKYDPNNREGPNQGAAREAIQLSKGSPRIERRGAGW
jgi:hypothetical protein